nr:hypothetical protein [Paraclostridium sp. AKS81]
MANKTIVINIAFTGTYICVAFMPKILLVNDKNGLANIKPNTIPDTIDNNPIIVPSKNINFLNCLSDIPIIFKVPNSLNLPFIKVPKE